MKKLKALFWGEEKMKGGSALLLSLIVLSTVALLTSNILAGISFPVFGWSIGGVPIVLTCGVLLFPITYILSDIFSQCYSYSVSRRATWIGFLANILLIGFVILGVVIGRNCGDAYYATVAETLQHAFGLDFLGEYHYIESTIDPDLLKSGLGSLGILIASLTAFVFGSWIDDLVFEKFRAKHGTDCSTKKFVLRAVGSSLAGELVDSIIFIPLLYLFTGKLASMSFAVVLAIIGIQAAIKTLYELLVSPLTAKLAKKISKYEAVHTLDGNTVRE